METSKGKEYFRSNLNIIQFALKKWKTLLGVALVSGALAVVFSGPSFIPPKYTSSAVIYPANLGNYSGETRLEQMQQYLESNAIRDSLIKKFNLYDEYDIDSSLNSSKAIMKDVFSEHVSFEETRFESILITAISKDPVKAKKMVDEIIEQLNKTIRRTEREKYREIVEINRSMLDQKKNQLDSLEQLIKKISIEYGILDYIAQSEEVTEGYMKFLLSGKKGEDYKDAIKLYNNLEKHGRYFHNLHAQLNVINEEYMERLNDYEYSLKDLNKYQTYSNVLVKPEVPDKKSSPVRWLIVLFAMVSAVGFTFVMFLFLGYQKS